MLSRHLNTVLFYILPLLIFALFFGVEAGLTPDQKIAFYSEFGIELFQEGLLFICLLLSVFIFFKLGKNENFWLRVWTGVAVFASFYIFIEEISWGQKFFKWESPEFFTNSTQKETNIHNHSQLFNRVPRTVLEIGILVGGLIIPGLMKWAPAKLPEKFSAIYPLTKIAFIAFLATIIKILEQFPGWLDLQIFYRKSEVMECFMYSFIFLYLISLLQKWRLEGRFKS